MSKLKRVGNLKTGRKKRDRKSRVGVFAGILTFKGCVQVHAKHVFSTPNPSIYPVKILVRLRHFFEPFLNHLTYSDICRFCLVKSIFWQKYFKMFENRTIYIFSGQFAETIFYKLFKKLNFAFILKFDSFKFQNCHFFNVKVEKSGEPQNCMEKTWSEEQSRGLCGHIDIQVLCPGEC